MRRLSQLSLLAKFGVLSAVLTLFLGVVLGQSLRTVMSQRTLSDARSEAALVLELALQRMPRDARLGERLDPRVKQGLDEVARAGLIAREVEAVKVWDRSARLVYSTQSTDGPSRPPAEVATALDGEISSRVAGAIDESLQIFVPFRSAGSGRVVGALELDAPYAPIAAGIRSDTVKLYAILLVGLGILYLSLFKIVAGASRRLLRQAADNERQARHDALTGLPNRTLFREVVASALAGRRRRDALLAVLVLDLDRFKEVNDTLGHANGDLLLQRIGPRLRATLRDEDTVARLSGDEYAIVLPGLPDRAAIAQTTQRLLEAMREPFVVGGLSLEVEASIGIAVYPEHGDRVETLMQRADVAMYAAKEAHTGFTFYSSEQHDYSPARLALVGELRRAIDENELTLFYQPKVDLESGRILGVEGLARWRHPRRGLLAPDEFVPLAEHTSLIGPLTNHVLETAIKQCRAWRKQGRELHVAVNLSMRNLVDLSLPGEVARLLDRYSVPPGCLELEITESTIMAEPRRVKAVLARLSEMGVSLSIDDFGTGYSSLGYLKELPVTTIKIDKSFVLDMHHDPDDAMIVESTIQLGHNLGLTVIAEGVEDQTAYDRLASLGCDVAQGFFLSRPVDAETLEQWLATWQGEGLAVPAPAFAR